MKSIDNHWASSISNHISLCNYKNISNLREDMLFLNSRSKLQPFLQRRFKVQMNNIMVERVVKREKSSPELIQIAFGAGDQIRKPRNCRLRRSWRRRKLLLHKCQGRLVLL